MGSHVQRGPKHDPLPVLENEKSYKQWKNAISMWSLVTEVERNKQAMVVAINLTGKAREAALEIDPTDLNKDDGVTTLLNWLDDKRLESYRAFQKLDDARKSAFQSMKEYVTSFQMLCDQVRSLGIAIPLEVLALRLLNGSGLRQIIQEDVLKSAEDISVVGIGQALLSRDQCKFSNHGEGNSSFCSNGLKYEIPSSTSSKDAPRNVLTTTNKHRDIAKPIFKCTPLKPPTAADNLLAKLKEITKKSVSTSATTQTGTSTPKFEFTLKKPPAETKSPGTTAKTPVMTSTLTKVDKKTGRWKCANCFVVNEPTYAKCECCWKARPYALVTFKPENVMPKTGLLNSDVTEHPPFSIPCRKENIDTANSIKPENPIPAGGFTATKGGFAKPEIPARSAAEPLSTHLSATESNASTAPLGTASLATNPALAVKPATNNITIPKVKFAFPPQPSTSALELAARKEEIPPKITGIPVKPVTKSSSEPLSPTPAQSTASSTPPVSVQQTQGNVDRLPQAESEPMLRCGKEMFFVQHPLPVSPTMMPRKPGSQGLDERNWPQNSTNVAYSQETSALKSLLGQPEIHYPEHINFPERADQPGRSGTGWTFKFQAPEDIDRDNRKLEADEEAEDAETSHKDTRPHFEPLVTLPEVEVRTGEEDEGAVFSERAKLYRWYEGQWKERGVGLMKILKHKETRKYRILMRRDQVLKICCNHFIGENLDLQPMPKTDKAWMWHAMDFTEIGGKQERLAIRFKSAEIANEFKEKFIEGQKSNANLSGGTPVIPVTKPSSILSSLTPDQSTSTTTHSVDVSQTRVPTSVVQSATSDTVMPKFKFAFPKPSAAALDLAARIAGTPRKNPEQDTGKEHGDEPDGGDDDDVRNETCDEPHFDPIIKLPDKVETKTGEEDEEVLFCHRAKLYRFADKQWKERGVGDIKILYNENLQKYRIVMRRDQVLKLCANHYITTDMTLAPMSNSDRAWTWTAMDHSDPDSHPQHEFLAIRFKSTDTAAEFEKLFNNAKDILDGKEVSVVSECKRDAPSSGSTTPVLPTFITSAPAKPKTSSPSSVQSQVVDSTSEGLLVAKKEAENWNCPMCNSPNLATDLVCPCCYAPNPYAPKTDGTAPKPNAPATKSGPTFAFGISSGGSSTPSFSLGIKSAVAETPSFDAPTKPLTSSTTLTDSIVSTTMSQVPLATLRVEKQAGKWNCSDCYAENEPTDTACPCCGKANPNAPATSKVETTGPKPGLFSFGLNQDTKSTFSFGINKPASETSTTKQDGTPSKGLLSPPKFGSGMQSGDTQFRFGLSPSFGTAANTGNNSGQQQQSSSLFSSNLGSNLPKPNIQPSTEISKPRFPSVGEDGNHYDEDSEEYETTDGESSEEDEEYDAQREERYRSPLNRPQQEQKQDDDNDVICLGEVLPSAELQRKAESLMLPKHFYNFVKDGYDDTEDGSESEKYQSAKQDSIVSSTVPQVPLPKPLRVKKQAGKWNCYDCYAENEPTDAACPCCGKANPNVAVTSKESIFDQKPARAVGSSTPFVAQQTASLRQSSNENIPQNSMFEALQKTKFLTQSDSKFFLQMTSLEMNHKKVVSSKKKREHTVSVSSDDPQAEKEIHFEPIVQLPEKVNLITGEEDEQVIFGNRAKLYAFHNETKEWKERGHGDVKILQNFSTLKVRVVMRREQVFKVCLNHLIQQEYNFTFKEPTAGKTLIWTARDFSDEEKPDGEILQFALRFKNYEIAYSFKNLWKAGAEAASSKTLLDPDPLDISIHMETPATSGSNPTAQSHQTPAKRVVSTFSFADVPGILVAKGPVNVTEFMFGERQKSEISAESFSFDTSKMFFDIKKTDTSQGALGTTPNNVCLTSQTELGTKTSASEALFQFQASFTKDSNLSMSSSKTHSTQLARTEDDEVIFVSELKPTNDQQKRAEKLLLPPTFFLFENKLMPPEFNERTEDEKEENILKFIEQRDSEKLELKNPKGVVSSGSEYETAEEEPSEEEGKKYKDDISGNRKEQLQFLGDGQYTSQLQLTNDSEEELDPSSFKCDAQFKPVLEKLPPLIKVKTGEEGEEVLFKERCKLYRYDKDTKQWKERGVGEIKILRNDEHKMHRVFMRRDQVFKVCTNHVIGENTNPELHLGSTKSCSYFVMDYSEYEIPTPEKIAVRFKHEDLCKAYMDKIDEIKHQQEKC